MSKDYNRILIVDDERDICFSLSGLLEDEGYQVYTAGSDKEALRKLEDEKPDLLLQDIWLQGSRHDGLWVVEQIIGQEEAPEVVMMSGHGTIDTAVRAIQLGAYDFIQKPFDIEQLLRVLKRATDARRLKRENQELRLRLDSRICAEISGVSSQIQQLKTEIEKLAPSSSRVLITGPAGVGKEVVARQIHASSKRSEKPFLVLSCASMNLNRIEAELFGEEHANGKSHSGILEAAHEGTILLDEIADIPFEVQGKILRALQGTRFCRIGGKDAIESDVRILSSTQKDMSILVKQGLFREDLYYRLRVFDLDVPPLCARREDIADMIQGFLQESAQQLGRPTPCVSSEAMALLMSYEWPGNVRQLKNVVEWIMISANMFEDNEIKIENLPSDIVKPPEVQVAGPKSLEDLTSLPLKQAREQFERYYLSMQIKRFGGNVKRTAEYVGMERSALHRKIRLLSVDDSS